MCFGNKNNLMHLILVLLEENLLLIKANAFNANKGYDRLFNNVVKFWPYFCGNFSNIVSLFLFPMHGKPINSHISIIF